jgi:hypothetical protein
MIVNKSIEAKKADSKGRSPYWVKGINPAHGAHEEKALSIFQPDILISAQFLATYERKFHLDPERTLLLAVLQDAIVCFQEFLFATSKKKQALFVEAEEWIFDEDKSYLYSFENVCELLGFEASYMRQGLSRWKETALEARGNKIDQDRLAS